MHVPTAGDIHPRFVRSGRNIKKPFGILARRVEILFKKRGIFYCLTNFLTTVSSAVSMEMMYIPGARSSTSIS